MELAEHGLDGTTPVATWLVSARRQVSGSVGGVQWGRVEPAVPWPATGFDDPSDDPTGAPDGREVFTAFCAALAHGPSAAARCFTEDGVFSHAPFVAGRPRVLARGRRAIEEALQDRRPGPPSLELVTLAQAGRRVMIAGWGNGPQGRKPFVSGFTMSADGALQRYLSVGVTEVTDHP